MSIRYLLLIVFELLANFWGPTPIRHAHLSLEGSKLRQPLTWQARELGLHKDLLHPRHALVDLFEQDAVADHVERLKLAALDHLEQMLPVLLGGRLAIAFEHDTAFREGAEVEMVCLEGEKREMLVWGSLRRGGGGEKEV